MKTYWEYVTEADRRYREYSNRTGVSRVRIGQMYFNVLHEVHPKLAELICASPADPFYRDDRFDDFLVLVGCLWDRPNREALDEIIAKEFPWLIGR